MPDPVAALRGFLLADPGLALLVDGRVFGGDLPRAETNSMPRSCAVVRTSGGAGVFGQGWQEYGDQRYDVICYGKTPLEAHRVWLAVHPALKQLTRVIYNGCLLHWCRPAGGPVPLRDPDTDWPYLFCSWQVLASEVEAA